MFKNFHNSLHSLG